MPTSTPPCCMSNSLPRMSGANTPVPSRNEAPWTLPCHDSGPDESRTDVGKANPDACPYTSTQLDRPLSQCHAPLPEVSPWGFSAASLALPSAPRSSFARLLPLAVRGTTAEQQNPYRLPHLSSPFAGSRQRRPPLAA